MPRKIEYNRNELIERARDLFWKQGWAGTSMKNLEVALKIKPGSFYAAFGSKDALFALALDKYGQDALLRLEALATEHGPIKALQCFLGKSIENETVPTKACMLAKTILELNMGNHPLSDKANKHLFKMEERFALLFHQAQAAGTINNSHDPKTLARRYQSDLIGLRVSAERNGVDAVAIAAEIADGLSRL